MCRGQRVLITEDHAVDVVGHLGLVAELHRLVGGTAPNGRCYPGRPEELSTGVRTRSRNLNNCSTIVSVGAGPTARVRL